MTGQMEQGHACGPAILEELREYVESLDYNDRTQWWDGFLIAAMGAAVASLGEIAAQAFKEALSQH